MNYINFDKIASDIINKDKYQSLKNESHHGLDRYTHSMSVAKMAYRFSKMLHLDYVSATRGALLHDYFNDIEYKDTKGIKKNSIHPVIALNNARREYTLNEKEENVIASHMFPFGDVIPNCREGWVVTSCDKIVAIKECGLYKIKEQLALGVIFIINVINVNM